MVVKVNDPEHHRTRRRKI